MAYNCKILYNSRKEYESLCKEFNNTISTIVNENRIDEWIHFDYDSDDIQIGIQYSNRFETKLYAAISKLTKDQNPEWTTELSDILGDSIRGIAKSVKYMDGFCKFVNCPNCKDDDELCVHFQEGFLNREVCNLIITNMINNVLFDTESAETQSERNGVMQRIRQFKCGICKKIVSDLESSETCIYCSNF